ncbi:hypothetical protein BH11PLA2_BH11PLA2_06310 [soil metagenome]
MQLFCPSCQAAFTAQSHCPKCGSRLLSPQESFITNKRAKAPPPDPIPATFSARITVGSIVAMGLVLGFREIVAALSVLQELPTTERWDASNADSITFGTRLFAVLVGGLIAGASRRQGLQVGAMVGLLVGGGLTGLDVFAAGQVHDFYTVLLAIAFPLIAGLAGATGSWLWPADADLPEPTHLSSHGSSMAKLAVQDAVRRRERPTAWFRIAFAATLVVIGVIASDSIRYGLSKGSGGWLNTGGINRSATMGLQIATILTILGGIISGMGTGAGFKHGLFAGILAGMGLLITSGSRPNGLFPALEGYLNFFDIAHDPLTTPRIGFDVMIGLLSIMAACGWLGGQLFPSLAPKKLWHRKAQLQS